MDYPDIEICPDSGGAVPMEIEICPDTDAPVPMEIELCPGRCENPPELFLTGTIAPDIGDQYTAIGGVQPYAFRLSCDGEISETGIITDLTGCCGSGTVTVTDACGQSTSRDVRWPLGQWVVQGYAPGSVIGSFQSDCEDPDINCFNAFPNGVCAEGISQITIYTPGCTWEHVTGDKQCYDGTIYECVEVLAWECP